MVSKAVEPVAFNDRQAISIVAHINMLTQFYERIDPLPTDKPPTWDGILDVITAMILHHYYDQLPKG